MDQFYLTDGPLPLRSSGPFFPAYCPTESSAMKRILSVTGLRQGSRPDSSEVTSNNPLSERPPSPGQKRPSRRSSGKQAPDPGARFLNATPLIVGRRDQVPPT